MDCPRLYLPIKVVCGRVGQSRRFQQPTKKTGSFRRRGIVRWHRAVSTDLVKQNVLVPKEESSSESDVGSHESQQSQKKKWMEKVRAAWGRILRLTRRRQPARARGEDATGLPPSRGGGGARRAVDDLIETVTDKSMKLLAQRHAELQQCEFLGDEILQSSKQFQRMSKRTTRKYKLKNVCFPCTCCC
ncbi:hypothetical protein GW7_07769 [Heterocephalus glaber]|uniref:Uncharacterized protein n=1 Tax=Heterocephalus glaber TaxID=10181 RepID=G5C230_HETGA|nr:hypothetical protein GW7_07769 [Heterocephalus glaber]